MKEFDPSLLIEKDILISSCPQSLYKSIFKSFLLNTGMRYRHLTLSGYDIMQAYLTNTDQQDFTRASEVDILLLYLTADPFNRAYSNVITSLIQKRRFNSFSTWIYTPHRIKEGAFTALYGSELAEFIDTKFIALNTQTTSKAAR